MQVHSSTYPPLLSGKVLGPSRGADPVRQDGESVRSEIGIGREADEDQVPRTKLLGAAESLPGQGSEGEGVRLDQLLSARSVFCPMCGSDHSPSEHSPDAVSAVPGGSVQAGGAEADPAVTSEVMDGRSAATALQPGTAAVLPSEDEEEAKSGRDGESDAVKDVEKTAGPAKLSEEEQKKVEELEERNREVRQHEQAHIAAGGQYVRGGASYEYENGPDGKRYAVGGEVSIDTSPVPDDPQGTIQKAQTIRRAALAPAEPSGQDRSVAASASRMETKARQELTEDRMEEMADGVGESGDGDSAEGVTAAELFGAPAEESDVPELDLPDGDAISTPGGTREPELLGGPAELLGDSSQEESGEDGPLSIGQNVQEGNAGAAGALSDLVARPEGLSVGQGSEGPRTVDGLSGAAPGEKIEKVELVQIDGGVDDEDDKLGPSISAASGPPVSRLDYGIRPDMGQMFDVYR